ncbi:DUF4177 domain-containing protein [Xanthomonas sp. CFBP 8703]|jgi:hypothetical protein|uniref:DUF4177 domain-containing protein n=1 Tax=Xanthomonas bonasiae TaxID=2810351 RepID=A0ABS3B358_9XANT|nr:MULTISPECIES: DUF4177 domain-containing protein [Xanthomonas]MCC4596086.1 DUF4177 domain-containing protein [Xanthomonas campestris pv. phormiicola]MBD7921810.1 DUF4177 domain-containing protein [Xanthomonas surreyensis]MBN6102967.1 DUF4177 domain-containing protein [Xanthomonas bonasiae]MBN6113419.1 DUF4177 domain-containing protein [Xanthomonas bonasiae]NYF22695.1 hypothetical protein [Xanthomonas sp. JAI131]
MTTRWTYLTVEVNLKPTFLGKVDAEPIQAELNKQGALGWELVNVISSPRLWPVLLVFKKAS